MLALTVFSPRARRRWLWKTASPKRMPPEGSRFHLGSGTRKRRRNSKRPSRSILIRSKVITSMPVPASLRESSSGQPRCSSVRQKTSRTTINPCACRFRSIGRLAGIGIGRVPHEGALNGQRVNSPFTLRIRGRLTSALVPSLR